jgi:hypothetical protein
VKRLIWMFLIVTRLRDRLRCPVCSAVGTYKLHAPTRGTRGAPVPWRWLCKFCGYYSSGARSGMLCYPSKAERCWVFYGENYPDTDRRTPQIALREALGDVWPWRG